MSRHMIDGRAFETDNAQQNFHEGSRWDGNNHISLATGSQWEHENLYLSMRDQWYIVWYSQWQGAGSGARFVDDDGAAAWLLANDYDLDDMPEELRAIAASNSE